MGDRKETQIEVKYQDKTAKLKIHGNATQDLHDALRARFDLPPTARLALVDGEGFDVVLDQFVSAGNYNLHVSGGPAPVSSGSGGSGVYMELKTKLNTPEAKEVYDSQKILRLGDTVPNFTADSTKGKINLHEYLGDSCASFSVIQEISLQSVQQSYPGWLN
jgi:hypothetical protein